MKGEDKHFELIVNRTQLKVIKNSLDCFRALTKGNYKKALCYIQKTRGIRKLTADDREELHKLIQDMVNVELKGAGKNNYSMLCNNHNNEKLYEKFHELNDDKDLYRAAFSFTEVVDLEHALEVYARMGTKQYGIAFSHTVSFSYAFCNTVERCIRSREQLSMPSNASYGIHCMEISDKFRCSWDLYQVVRYARSWACAEHAPEERNKHFSKYMTVNYDTPIRSSKQPMAVCKVVDMLSSN